ncbi:diacylglycerol kinase family lipid kinase [Robertmurraya sp. DFI.2.37]|jgi:YegS/Rv2252/BmrU family lipid kinase|uniref:diacylglycerol/lipid kinase family protein n=1 Tax=Robertmurraya sp. DFI.2.37 TaxID=3031819 RepID=UPI0012456CBB|nr:diacylglycerol kinase family protein [Robertmurraya sp. DFI.2.37]MDF1508677.1 diacylglycerol kinase family lipid kinase [Robertmurraya sp. DFI.2.37]
MNSIHFIINPQAKNGYSMKVWKKVEKRLALEQIPFHATFTKYRGHAVEIVRALLNSARVEDLVMIVAIGGDGTLHEVINGAANARNVMIGMIPAGSGNDFRRGYGVPKNPLAALKFISEQVKTRPFFADIGEIKNEQGDVTYFINNMGVGFDALITKVANTSRLKRFLNQLHLGSLVYAYFVIKKLFSFQCSDVNIVIDGKSFHFKKAWFVTVSNQPFYGGGMKISPQADVNDGLLNVTIVQNLSRLKFLLVFITVFWGGHTKFKEVKELVGKQLTVQSSFPFYAHADGEYIGESPVHITVHHQALPLLTKKVD